MKFKLSNLSQYRSSLMGAAMIWIVLYHYQLRGVLAYPLGNGFTGVDIFMFVSGMGLYYSITKDSNLKHFYRKRFLRVFPLYYIIGLVYVLIEGSFNFWNYLWRYSTLGFWTDGTIGNGWFIPSIVAVYMVYPFVHLTVFRKGIDKTALIVLGTILIFFIIYNSFVDQTVIGTKHYLLLYRVPIFLFGMLIGYSISENKDFSRRFILIAVALLPLFLIHFVVYDNIRIRYLSTTFTVPLIMVVICVFLNYSKRVQTVLGGVGNASLEIFMLHPIPMLIWEKYNIEYEYHNWVMLFTCLIVIVISIVIHKLWEKILIVKPRFTSTKTS